MNANDFNTLNDMMLADQMDRYIEKLENGDYSTDDENWTDCAVESSFGALFV